MLATLANHIDEVKWQLGEADKAFEEASSATHEYEIFNNTAQASIDKAKKRVTELAVQLGEKLYPIMKHIYSSSGLFLRALNQIVSFIIEYKGAILSLMAGMVGYYTGAAIASANTKAFAVATKIAKVAQEAWIAVQALASAAVSLFTGKINAAVQSFKIFSATIKANPIGLFLGTFTALFAGLATLRTKMEENRKEAKRLAEEQRKWKESISNVDEASNRYAANELSRLKALYNAATEENSARKNRIDAAQKMQSLYPSIFSSFSTEEIMAGKAKKAYDELSLSIIKNARARAAAEKIQENEKLILDLEDELEKNKAWERNAGKRAENAKERRNRLYESNSSQHAFMPVQVQTHAEQGLTEEIRENTKQQKQANQNIKDINKKRSELKRANDKLAKIPGVGDVIVGDGRKTEIPYTGAGGGEPSADKVNGNGNGNGTGSGDGGEQNRFAVEEEAKERAEAEARIAYATGKKNYLDYLDAMNEASKNYYESLLKRTDLSEMERLKIQAQYEESRKKIADQGIARSAEEEEARYNNEMATLRQRYIDGHISKKTFDASVEEQEIIHQRNLTKAYAEGSKERLQAERQLQQLLMAQTGRRQQETEAAEKKLAEIRKKYFGQSPAEKQWQYFKEYNLLMQAYDREMTLAKNNAEEKLRIEKAFQIAKLALQKEYGIISNNEEKSKAEQLTQDLIDWFDSDTTKKFLKSYSVLTSGMGAIFSSLTSLVQAELELQTASIEKRYEKEISAAEGNSYRVKKLEKEKEREIARAKEEANRKMFAMQVIQAIAQTAQNAISAYGDGLQIGGLAGLILAPIAASMAVAAGMIQIAAIKKQQQASAAQGYSTGGFTPDGKVDEPVGIVHGGEWVASQKLVKSPRTRPLIEALDYAQRNNTIGSLKAADVSRSITAPMVLAQQSASPQIVMAQSQPTVVVEQNREYADTMRRLADRLAEPFVTVATVTGDKGINKAQEEYDRLMRNKKPKSRK